MIEQQTASISVCEEDGDTRPDDSPGAEVEAGPSTPTATVEDVLGASDIEQETAENISVTDSEEDGSCLKTRDGRTTDALVGRRIVELGLLAERLERGCYACSKALRLINVVKEERFGLASVLHVKCSSGGCGAISMVQTSKTHRSSGSGTRRVYDVNTKAALGESDHCTHWFRFSEVALHQTEESNHYFGLS